MYRPNFCSECGAKIIRLHWRPWSSRKFCDVCAVRLRKERFILPLAAASALMGVGMVAGRAGRPAPPPLIIERHTDSPFFEERSDASEQPDVSSDKSGSEKAGAAGLGSSSARANSFDTESTGEVVYICGARTKKGKPCSRRMRAPVRCWQHKGMPAMLPNEKLVMSDKL